MGKQRKVVEYVINCGRCECLEDLIDEVMESLSAPSYYSIAFWGNTWDTMNSLLQDLAWLNGEKLILVFDGFHALSPKLEPSELTLLISVFDFITAHYGEGCPPNKVKNIILK